MSPVDKCRNSDRLSQKRKAGVEEGKEGDVRKDEERRGGQRRGGRERGREEGQKERQRKKWMEGGDA